MRLAISTLAALACYSPFNLEAQQRAVTDVDLDHVILSATSLTRGIDEFTRLTGIVPKRGGQHPGRGTENALVSLGQGHYLEILAPILPSSDSTSMRAAGELIPVGWALHTRALDSLIAKLRAAGLPISDPTPGSRLTPDSTLLQWRTATVRGPGLELAPFFIEWSASTPHPSTTSPAGCSLAALELTIPDSTPLQAFFRVVGYRVEVRAGSPAAGRLVLDCPRGRVTFPHQGDD